MTPKINQFYAESTASSYQYLLHRLNQHGASVQVGPEMTTEMAPFIGRFDNPKRRLIDPPGRNLNFAYCVVEALDVLMNKNPGQALKFNKNLAKWMLNGKFPGHYGERINAGFESAPRVIYDRGVPYQLYRCYDELKERPTSRRAIITIHNPMIEDYDSKDVACTMDLQFLIRDGKLHCIAHMRSNDALWGFCYDTWFFQFLQESMASWLGVNLGYYYHIAGSLHYYHQRHKQINKVLKRASEPWLQDEPVPIEPMSIHKWSDIIKSMWNGIHLTTTIPGDIINRPFPPFPEPFNSYYQAVCAEVYRKRRLKELCEYIYQSLPESDVKQWVKRRCKI